MTFVDFKQLKRDITISQVCQGYNLGLTEDKDKLRGACPVCKDKGTRTFVVTPAEGVWHCFKCKKGGDMIALISQIKGIDARNSALDIKETCKGIPIQETDTIEPLDYLIHEHEAVQELGIPPEVAKELGIGYAKKGIMRGRVTIPMRDDKGNLIAYCGYSPKNNDLKLPKF